MARIYNELRNYQNVPRELVFDKNLSDRARFVYVFMACKPDDWDFYLEPMAKDIGYSVETLRKYINELVTSGWLIKGEQTNKKGVFGAVEYTLKATKISDTEFFRHGNNQPQINTELIKEETKENTNVLKKELFEKCWLAYRRKGSKKKAKEYWNKLNESEMDMVLPHIKAYVSSREVHYQKDFERYLRDKVFETVVYNGNNIVYDPTRNDGSEGMYNPTCGGGLMYNETSGCYLYIGWYTDGDDIPDGYTKDSRPDGATIMLNNARGTLVWSRKTKEWRKK